MPVLENLVVQWLQRQSEFMGLPGPVQMCTDAPAANHVTCHPQLYAFAPYLVPDLDGLVDNEPTAAWVAVHGTESLQEQGVPAQLFSRYPKTAFDYAHMALFEAPVRVCTAVPQVFKDSA